MTTSLPEASEHHLKDRSSRYGTVSRAIKSEALWFGLLLAATCLLAGLRLDDYPRLGFDEGYYLQLARNLTMHGEYALASPPQEFDWFGLGNSSPTLGLPIALSFKLLGIGVAQGRLVSALYLVGAVVAVYLLMRHLYSWSTAALSAALFIVAGPTNASLFYGDTLISDFSTIWMGRKVLGEVPALFFFLLGAWAWFHSWEERGNRWLVGAGLLFGLVFATKEQFLPMVVPALVLVWLADRLYYRKLEFRHLAVPLILSGIPLAIWYGYKLAVLGPEAFGRHLATLSQVSRASTWLFSPSSWSSQLSFLYHNAFLLMGLPGILYTLAQGAHRDLSGLKSLLLPILAAWFLIWFAFLSIGWPRYGYPGLALSSVLAAKPLSDLIVGLSLSPRRLWASMRRGEMTRPAIAAIVAALIIVYPLQDLGRQVLFDTDRTPQQFAAYVEAHTENDALIENFEWEVDFLSTRRYHHPPPEVFVQLLRKTPDRTYDPLAYRPSYLIDGLYSKGTGLYPDTWLRQCCRKIGTVGNYDLYAVLDVESP
jgi:4-amino-4-deoxy-L-arabinose transferase-like glycosyltransferase